MSTVTFKELGSLNDSVFGKSTEPIKMFLEKKAEAYEAESLYDKIFFKDTSSNFAEKITGMTAMDGFKPTDEGATLEDDSMQEGYSKVIEHIEWTDKFSISRKIIDDAKTMDLRKRPEAFLAGYYRTREQYAAALYGAAIGGSTAFRGKSGILDPLCADGQNVFATEHPSKVHTDLKQTNKFSDAFSAEALAAVETAMQNFRGDNGEVLNVIPNTIMIPNDYKLKMAVFAALGADKDPATSNNGFNYTFGRYNVIINPYLNQYLPSGTTPWFLLDMNYAESNGGGVWFDRVPLEVSNEVKKDPFSTIWYGYSRFAAGFADWRYVACGGVTGGTEATA